MVCRSYFKRLFHTLLVICLVLLARGAWAEDLPGNSQQNNSASQSSDGKRSITAVRTEVPIRIDGFLDDPAWKNTLFQGGFIQREPNEGAPSTEKTEVGFLYDEKHLYIGIKCYDSSPGKIIAREMRRDAFLDDDDYFEFVLDTYHDHRSAYYFITNPHGVKRESKLGSEGRDYNPAWDGVWWCKSKITDQGWFVEIAIPWKTLKFEEERSPSWGFNCARMIRRKNEHVYWELIPRHIGQHAGIFRLSEAGSLTGIADVKMGGNLELMPYVLGGMENDANTHFTTDR
ncbi:MAG: carbohydrate binding family 9 domain-containing protein, partial [Candidatus Aminicenantes bacterium]|nr:carbohydrate binding family 9 domain-containing protein [Candidatus Aminicenantes bacterium]